ncbi:MAG: ribosomal L7Ae/L30e/S12e/Gadd45 family protein [Eubacteriales bacterium]|nr:ribosomal L7Ae/L30e/S12e/Gadd45 family protein [Eubacteriales bacterium]MDD3881530.1 ribosomal L7Ae/L30e/S12e/Gadd45 family protein [Eubacteriales bacterium]MDD4512988.1 ribosomal L7Ae/L30e/S12e/Gadd45 family protein [Eubacteriales bacterium]
MPMDLGEHSRLVVGTKQILRAIEHGEVEYVYMAKDADTHITHKVLEMCQKKQIRMEWVDSMLELGKACRIDVGAAAAGICRLQEDN